MQTVQECFGRFRITYYSAPLPGQQLVEALKVAPTVEDKGRGGIRLLDIDGRKLVCRKYLHGGIFRALTRDFFFSEKRAKREADIMLDLQEHGVPVITPFLTVAEEHPFTKRLYLVTCLEEEAVSLLDYLRTHGGRERMRAIKKFAGLVWELERNSIYHPDLHLRNVILTSQERMLLLDFDKARKKIVSRQDVKSMFWRLSRFVDKVERGGQLSISPAERMLFLRTYARLSRYNVADEMRKRESLKSYFHRLGWFIESLLYGGGNRKAGETRKP